MIMKSYWLVPSRGSSNGLTSKATLPALAAKASNSALRLSFMNWVGCQTMIWPSGPTAGAMISAQ